MALLLSHQSMRGDLERAGEYFFRQVQSNTNIKICLRQDSPDDAEEMAKCGGTYTTVKRTEQVEQSLWASADGLTPTSGTGDDSMTVRLDPQLGSLPSLYAIHGTATDDVWAIVHPHQVARWDGERWNVMRFADIHKDAKIMGVWGASADEIWAVTFDGRILRRAGGAWVVVAGHEAAPLCRSAAGPEM